MGIDVPVYGMVKDDKHRTRAITEDGGEIAIQSTRAVFTLVSSIQDEVHRFAIGYHRQQRKKATISTTLTSIPGIGETRAKALMKHFTTIRAVSEATEEMLEETPGMNAPAARRLPLFPQRRKRRGITLFLRIFRRFSAKTAQKRLTYFYSNEIIT